MTLTATDLAQLQDRTVILALEEITYTLASSAGQEPVVDTPAKATELLDALWAAASVDPVPVTGTDPQTARAVLARLAAEQDSADVCAPVLADPPADDQLSLVDSMNDIVVLAAVVTWLRLKVDFRFTREDERNSVHFEVGQKPASTGFLQELAQTVKDFFQQP
ncbi:hypothetical protein [Streptomyces sp. ID05-47C]|uniref:hypothetical protein n=1 Tax=Streptomyces sp. ID05-47C TaxID=3028665 RepID=UPI0029A95D29|nr:hypothetical protein [Streptomyces sp. ID05-47C]MDX3569051.1 hypothetical protein [Streptomyces sp. ID05-47C]